VQSSHAFACVRELPILTIGPIEESSMSEAIHFYRVSEEYGCFSNFAPYPIELD
jgi:hypothetical protein